MNFGPVIATRKGFTSIPQLDYSRFSDSVDLSHNPIRQLNGLPVLTGFQTLIVDGTKLESFAGACPQPDILSFSCCNTPLGNSRFLALMALIVFGEQLEVVNNQKISDRVREDAKKYKDSLYDYLKNGYVIVSLDPLKVADLETHKRKIVETQEDQTGEVEIFMNEEEDEENQQKELIEDAQRKLRYRFNELVHPPTRQAKEKPQKSKNNATKEGKTESPRKSYRASVRESPKHKRVNMKISSPFEQDDKSVSDNKSNKSKKM